MEHVKFDTGTLGQVTDDYYFAAECSACKHRRRLSLASLRAHLGADYRLMDIRPRLKCESCGGRKIIVSFLAPSNRHGILHRLFEEKPG